MTSDSPKNLCQLYDPLSSGYCVAIFSNCVVKAHVLSPEQIKLFSTKLDFDAKETLELLYDYEEFLKGFELKDHFWFGVTSHRIFAINEGTVVQVALNEVKSVEHKSNGIFKCDELLVTTLASKTVTFKVYRSSACVVMKNHIEQRISEFSKAKAEMPVQDFIRTLFLVNSPQEVLLDEL